MHTDKVLITGGAGFIGSNLAASLCEDGYSVRIFDNLSRPGSPINLGWLQENYSNIEFFRGDIRDYTSIAEALIGIDTVFHFASQVAVTSSVIDPRSDFDINTMGTINLLEAARRSKRKPIVSFTSTNKVYGNLDYLNINELETRYELENYPHGISEKTALDFHSPYGCSKGAADQYVRDYSRIYDLPTIVFRMSCIYGTRQFGTEDQGWVAHLLISIIKNQPITIFGNGKQVRDLLWVQDLVRAFRSAVEHIDITRGQIYNIGGGPENSIAIWKEFGKLSEELVGQSIDVRHTATRPGDQKIYISDTTKAKIHFGWQPKINREAGISKLYQWLLDNKTLIPE
jgi:CDP-paratose 2-epimerase